MNHPLTQTLGAETAPIDLQKLKDNAPLIALGLGALTLWNNKLLILLGGLGYYYYMQQQKPPVQPIVK